MLKLLIVRPEILLRNEAAFGGPHGDFPILQTDKALFLIDKNKGIRAFEVGDVLRLISEDIMNLEGLFLLFDQNVLVELLNKFDILQMALIGNVH